MATTSPKTPAARSPKTPAAAKASTPVPAVTSVELDEALLENPIRLPPEKVAEIELQSTMPVVAVIVTVTITRPTTETIPWSQTIEGNVISEILTDIFQSYPTHIEYTINIISPLIAEAIVFYDSHDVYLASRQEALNLIPTLIQARDSYYQSVGGSVVQTLNVLP